MLRKILFGVLLSSFCSAALASTIVPAGGLTFTSVTHNFGAVAVGHNAVYGVQVKNTSYAAVSFSVVLGTTGAFTNTSSCGSSVAAGATCDLTFTFAPTATGSQSTTWTVNSNAGSYSPSNGGTLSGTGAALAGVTLSTSYHNFGGQVQNSSSGVYGIVVSNSTSDPIALTLNSQPSYYIDFPIYLNNCPATLPANGQCNLQWQFKPASTTAYQTVYTISGVDTVTNQAVNISSGTGVVTGVTLLGTGTNPGVTVTSYSHDFGEQAVNTVSQAYGVTLFNSTSSAVTLTYGTVPTGFKLLTNTCGNSVAPGGTCNGSFEFDPKTTGTFGGTIPVSAKSNGNPVTVTSGGNTVTGISLKGTASTGGMTLTTTTHNFGYFTQGQTSPQYGAELTNTGTSTIDLNFAFSSGNQGFSLYSNSCNSSLAAGKNCELIFTFSPTANTPMKAVQDVYKITATDTSNGQSVAIVDKTDGAIVNGVTLIGNVVTGNGLGTTTSVHNFGEVGVGGTAAAYGVVVYNTGSQPVTMQQSYASSTDSTVFTTDPGNSTCPAMTSLPANGSCTLTFYFTPNAAGYFTNSYQVNGGGQAMGIQLSGTGVE